MTEIKKVGIVERLPYEEINHFEWNIPDFFTIVEERKYMRFDSSTFSVADTSWYLILYPHWQYGDKFIQLLLCNHMKRNYMVEYYFGLKKCDGTVEQIGGIIMKGYEATNSDSYKFNFIKKSELVQRKSELVPGNILTITCTVKLMIEMTHSSGQIALDTTRRLTLTGLDKLSQNFKDLFDNKETCDVTLRVQDKEYQAHRLVLIARSRVFAAIFKHDTLERQTGVITIPDCDSNSFEKFLEYLYCGKLEELSHHSAQSLYYTSDKYDVEELKAFCIEYMIQSLTVENVSEVVVFADKYEERLLLFAVQKFFNKNLSKILVSPEWDCLLEKDRHLANKLMIEMSKGKA